MDFYIENEIIKSKIININTQIATIKNPLITISYINKDKYIYGNKGLFIHYNFKKQWLHISGFTILNNTTVSIEYRIDIKYYNRYIFKFHTVSYIYTNYKIIIPNKYELIYYSAYFYLY